jgi:hypothetical protein
MTRKIKALPRTFFSIVVVLLLAVSTIWIWRHRTKIADFWSNVFLYYQD